MTVELRRLKATDLFAALRVIGKLEITGDLKRAWGAGQEVAATGTVSANEVGAQVLFEIVEKLLVKLPEVETEFNAFLGSVTQAKLSAEQVGDLDYWDYFELIKNLVMQKELVDFLGSKLSSNKSATMSVAAPLT